MERVLHYLWIGSMWLMIPYAAAQDTPPQVHIESATPQSARQLEQFRSIQPQYVQDAIVLDLGERQADRLKISKLDDGQPALSAATSNWTSGNELTIRPGETFVIEDTAKKARTTEMLSSGRRIYFPGQVVKNVGIAPATGRATLNKWELFMIATDSPLSWQAEKMAYTTDILLGLSPVDETTGPFDGNIDIHFRKFGTGINIVPDEVALTSSGMNNTRRVSLTCTAFDINPEIEVISDVGSKRAIFPLKPRQLEVSVSNPVIPGFGLGSSKIIVKTRDIDGSLISEDAIDILLDKNGPGEIQNNMLTKASGSLEAAGTIKSAGTGKATITAESPLFMSGSDTITYVWPLTLLLISIGGGMVGSGVRLYRLRKIKGLQVAGHLLVGMVSGFLLVLAAAVGITQMDVTTSIATTNTGAIVLSLIGGYAGDGVFEWLGRKMGVLRES